MSERTSEQRLAVAAVGSVPAAAQGRGARARRQRARRHAEQALQNARDVYARRGEAVSIWVVPSAAITASTPDDMGPFFDPGNDKAYRHPQFYKVPRGVRVSL